jgi:hypothetical protein
VAVDSAAAAEEEEEEEEAADEDEPDSQTIFAGKYENCKNHSIEHDSEPRFLFFSGRSCFWSWRLLARRDERAARKNLCESRRAVAALRLATAAADTNALRVILGPSSEDLQNPDRIQATNELKTFSSALAETNHLVHVSNTLVVLELGDDLWPFPVPIVKKDGGWFFDYRRSARRTSEPPHRQERTRDTSSHARLCGCAARIRQQRPRWRRDFGICPKAREFARENKMGFTGRRPSMET